MLDCGHEQPVAGFTPPADLDCRRQGRGIRFGRATRESDIPALGPNQPGHVLARLLDQAARCTPFRVHRRRITG
jgi:hypothetical protein